MGQGEAGGTVVNETTIADDAQLVELTSEFNAANGLSAEAIDRCLDTLPIGIIGNADPLHPENIDYPNVLFHAAGRRFDLDTNRDYRTTVGETAAGAHTGKGLYCAAEPVAAAIGGEYMVTVLPKEAMVLDLTDPLTEQSLSDDFRDAFTTFQRYRLENDADLDAQAAYAQVASAGLNSESSLVAEKQYTSYAAQIVAQKEIELDRALTSSEKKQLYTTISDVFSRANSIRIMNEPATSLRTLFAMHSPINGPVSYDRHSVERPVYNLTTSLDFLVGCLGVDGAKTIQTFEPKLSTPTQDGDWIEDDPLDLTAQQLALADLDPDLLHGYVFWKLDMVADEDSWERLEEEHGLQVESEIASSADEIEEVTSYQRHPNVLLSGNEHIDAAQAERLIAMMREGHNLLDATAVGDIIRGLVAEHIDPYDTVSNLAHTSNDVASLLSARVGLVIENFRLHEHTQAVLGGFEDTFAAQTPPEDRKVVRTALLLQDIGKPLAVAATGDKAHQTQYNAAVKNNLSQHLLDRILLAMHYKERRQSVALKQALMSYQRGYLKLQKS
jgi:hypothetical protein